jgi:hypothetical protein
MSEFASISPAVTTPAFLVESRNVYWFIAVNLDVDVLKVQHNINYVFFDTINGGEFMRSFSDLKCDDSRSCNA